MKIINAIMILFSNRQVWANSVNPDQTAPKGLGLQCLPFHLHLLDTLIYDNAT